MIYEIFGLPRSGKTTLMTAEAQNQLNGKSILGINPHKKIFTTFYCKGCYKINFDDLKQYDFRDSLILIDEISLYADNRNFKNFDDGFLYFFKLHGHYKIDLVWSSQSYQDADKKIRDVTDTIFLVEPSILPHTSIVKKIYHNYSFKGRTITDTYDIANRLEWKYINRKKYYKYFDSYETKKLPEIPELEKW